MTISRAVETAYGVLGAVGARESSERLRIELTMKFVERVAGPYAGKRILELGSSLGLHLIAAHELGAAQAVGIDKFIFPEAGKNAFYVSPDEMGLLQNAWKTHGVDISRGDLADPLPFPDGTFDLVICNAVVEHLQGIHKQVFAEAHRVLAPGGTFVFTTPNNASLLKRARFFVGRSPNWDLKDFFDSGPAFTGHTREFTREECRKMLEWSGFTSNVVTTKPSYFRWSWLKSPRKAHKVLFQSLSRLSPSWGDLIFAAGKKSTRNSLQPSKTMDPSEAKEYTKLVRSWWNDHPFTLGLADQTGEYDITGRVQQLDERFFSEVDRKMRKQYGTSGQNESDPLLSKLVPYAELRGKKVLDIAVGSGWSAVTLARAGAEVTGIDLTEEAVRMTKRHAEIARVPIEVKQMDAQELAFPDHTFDYVLAWGCVMHMPDTERALREISRVLKPGGRMLAYMYNKSSWTYWFNFLFLRGVLGGALFRYRFNTTAIVSRYTDGAPKGGNMLTKVYSPSEARRMYEANGFTNVSVWPFYIPHEVTGWPMGKFPVFRYLPRPVKEWMGKKWAWGLIVTAEKKG